MPNIYDQFDPTPSSAGANIYDQFDQPAAAPSAERPTQQIARGFEQLTSGGDLERAIAGIQQGQDIDVAVQAAQQAPQAIPDRLKAVQDILAGVGRGAVQTEGAQLTPFGFKPSIIGTVKGLYETGKSAAALPGEVYAGQVDPLSEEGIRRAGELAMFATPTAPRVGLPAATRVPSPTVAQLYEHAGYGEAPIGYKAPEVTGTVLKPQAATRLADELQGDFKYRYSDANAPKTFEIVGNIENRPSDALPVVELEGYRKQLGDISPVKDQSGLVQNKADLEAARIARSRIDEVLRTAPENQEILFGSPERAMATLETARADVSAAKSAEVLNQAQARAALRESRTGRPVSDQMQAYMENILNNPSLRRGYTQGEQAMMQSIVGGGGRMERALRGGAGFVGNLAAAATAGVVGHAAAGPVGTAAAAVPYLVSAGMKALANRLAIRDINRLNEMLRADSPLGRQMAGPLEDWARANEALETAQNARTYSRALIAARNLSNNLKDAGIELSPRRLIGPPRGMAGEEKRTSEGYPYIQGSP